MSNNSILMTDDSWATAKMAIGKFEDANLGTKWGIVAPMVVGTMIAGEELVIESQKKDGGVAVVKVDAEGCRLYITAFSVQKSNEDESTTQILLDPSVGIAIGAFPLLDESGMLNEDNVRFWVDTDGVLNVCGTIVAEAGDIGGWIIGTDGLHSGEDGATGSTYVGLSSAGTYRIWAGAEAPEDAPFSVQADGKLTTTAGFIGGWVIGEDYIGNESTRATSTVGLSSYTDPNNDPAVSFWAGGSQDIAPFRVMDNGTVYASNLQIGGGSITISDNGVAMFSVSHAGHVSARDIAITGGSITIQDNGVTTFSVTSAGALTATTGVIAGLTITSTPTGGYLSYGGLDSMSGTNDGVYLGTDGLHIRGTDEGDETSYIKAGADGSLEISGGIFRAGSWTMDKVGATMDKTFTAPHYGDSTDMVTGTVSLTLGALRGEGNEAGLVFEKGNDNKPASLWIGHYMEGLPVGGVIFGRSSGSGRPIWDGEGTINYDGNFQLYPSTGMAQLGTTNDHWHEAYSDYVRDATTVESEYVECEHLQAGDITIDDASGIFTLQSYTYYDFSMTANQRTYLTANDLGVSTPAGYTPIAIASAFTTNTAVAITSIRGLNTGAQTFLYLVNLTGSAVSDVDIVVTILYAKKTQS